MIRRLESITHEENFVRQQVNIIRKFETFFDRGIQKIIEDMVNSKYKRLFEDRKSIVNFQKLYSIRSIHFEDYLNYCIYKSIRNQLIIKTNKDVNVNITEETKVKSNGAIYLNLKLNYFEKDLFSMHYCIREFIKILIKNQQVNNKNLCDIISHIKINLSMVSFQKIG